MDKERIEENRKYVNASEGMVFDYVRDLDLWIIGSYGPVDILPDGIEYESLLSSDFANIKESLLPYITVCDASEGFNVCKFKTRFLVFSEIEEIDIYVVLCTNNGATYFASSSIAALRSFVLYVNEEIRNNRPTDIRSFFGIDASFTVDNIDMEDWTTWHIISCDKYEPVECWPSHTKWIKSDDRDNYLPFIYNDNKSRELKSVCFFTMPFWDGGREIRVDDICAIKCTDDTIYFASQNQDTLRAFVLWTNEGIRVNNEWRRRHPR